MRSNNFNSEVLGLVLVFQSKQVSTNFDLQTFNLTNTYSS
ncbi:9237_t:CDS:2 [Ambispora leptoticha]|uniref:9237_t:CDS:1 n=1 Tax=Ambispora leptoticha TaxID=144679 RepID=A0A9N8ZSV3_9GLOM|nr:9237_t:CDS:2 [Ambispora leptoticha]